jgi:hypothetical protein
MLATSRSSVSSFLEPKPLWKMLIPVACISIIVAVLVAMIAIGIQKPDVGNILAVRPDVPLVKGLGPVLNIILAYSMHDLLRDTITSNLTIHSRPCSFLFLPSRAQRPARLQEGTLLRTKHRNNLLHDHLSSHLLLRRPRCRQSRARLRKPPRHQDRLRHCAPDNHRSGCCQRLRGLQVHLSTDLGWYQCGTPDKLQEHR